MATPDFPVIASDSGDGVSCTCGGSCTSTASPSADCSPRREHCCCGKVHLVGARARSALETYLAERKATRKREPEYDIGEASIDLAGAPVEVAWAFPRQ